KSSSDETKFVSPSTANNNPFLGDLAEDPGSDFGLVQTSNLIVTENLLEAHTVEEYPVDAGVEEGGGPLLEYSATKQSEQSSPVVSGYSTTSGEKSTDKTSRSIDFTPSGVVDESNTNYIIASSSSCTGTASAKQEEAAIPLVATTPVSATQGLVPLLETEEENLFGGAVRQHSTEGDSTVTSENAAGQQALGAPVAGLQAKAASSTTASAVCAGITVLPPPKRLLTNRATGVATGPGGTTVITRGAPQHLVRGGLPCGAPIGSPGYNPNPPIGPPPGVVVPGVPTQVVAIMAKGGKKGSRSIAGGQYDGKGSGKMTQIGHMGKPAGMMGKPVAVVPNPRMWGHQLPPLPLGGKGAAGQMTPMSAASSGGSPAYSITSSGQSPTLITN
ncbi:unnamed protein product, partial [Amoebophrya sp. A25]